MRVTWLMHTCDRHDESVVRVVWHDAFICVTWIIHVKDMTHSYVCHDSFICDVWHDLFIWLIYMCDMTHSYCDMTRSYVWQAFDLGRLPPPSRTESDVQRTNSNSTETESEEGIIESCHTNEWVMSHIWMRHVTHMNESCRTYEWVVSHIWMSHGPIAIAQRQSLKRVWKSHVTRMNESWHIREWVTDQ